MIDILHKHLNKYLIRIIREYNEIDLNKLILNSPKRKIFQFTLRDIYTIEDLIIKSFNLGYKGFLINDNDRNKNLIKFLDYYKNEKILIQKHDNKILYSFIDDTRNEFYIDIVDIDVLISIIT